MKWNQILSVGTRVVGAILTGVPAVEAFVARLKSGTGADKKGFVLDLVKSELAAAEIVLGHPIAQDAELLAAAGAISDAVVTFHNLLALKVTAGRAPA